MIDTVYQHLFKPEYLVLNPQGAIHFDHNLNLISINYTPGELQKILSQKLFNQKPLRIIIASYDHLHTKTYCPTQNYWQQHQFLKQLTTRQDFSGSMHFSIFKNNAAHITSIPYCDNLNTWMQVVNSTNRFVLSIESLVVGLSLTATTPQLYIFPDRFNQLLFMFASGQAGLFFRYLSCDAEAPPLIEIQRTIHYICREFMISSEDIDVISSFTCPEIQPAMHSWQHVPIATEHCERYFISLLNLHSGHRKFKLTTKFKINKLKFLWNKLHRCLIFTVAIVLTVINSINYYQNQNLQQKIDRIQVDNLIQQREFDSVEHDARLHEYQQLQLNNQPYMKAYQVTYNLLDLLYRLSLSNLTLPPMTHLVFSKATHPDLRTRLLIEFKINDEDHNNDDGDHNISAYCNFLQTQFSGATVKIDQENLISGSLPIDPASELSPVATIVIQIDNIKL